MLDTTRTDLIPDFIIACCVLHNICLIKSDELPVDEDIGEENENNNENFNDIRSREAATEGAQKRNVICYRLPIRNV